MKLTPATCPAAFPTPLPAAYLPSNLAAFCVVALLGLSFVGGSPARAADGDAKPMPRVAVSDDGDGFVLKGGGDGGSGSGGGGIGSGGARFVPFGFNYDHDRDGDLIEDYWHKDWDRVVGDFEEMAALGANVVRIHLQFGRFMDGPDEPNEKELDRLAKLLDVAERVGLYLDITGLGCYHKDNVPGWYHEMDEAERWAAQAAFWEAVAKTCADSPAVFCYDLMNEPVVPGGKKKQDTWLPGSSLGGKHFVQYITRERGERERTAVAREWIGRMVDAIREHDAEGMITVGLVPWSLDRPGLTSGFVPGEVTGRLDFIAMHLYPEKGKVGEAIETLKGFDVGKPIVIEETFPLKSGMEEWREFLRKSKEHADGWVSFYWGAPVDELRGREELKAALLAVAIEGFVGMKEELVE